MAKSGAIEAPKPFKQSFYEIVLKCMRRGDISLQSNGSWIFFISNLPQMVYRGYEYVQPCLYGRKTPKEAIFGGIQHYQVGLPYNPIIKRVYKKWCKENPIDPKGKIRNEVLWIYELEFDGIAELVADWPEQLKERRQAEAEEAAHYQKLLESGYFDDDDDDSDYDYSEDDFEYFDNEGDF